MQAFDPFNDIQGRPEYNRMDDKLDASINLLGTSTTAFLYKGINMTINILTLFPKMFKSVFSESIINRAQNRGLVEINIYNLRDWAPDKHKTVDDKPYGGGAGMVIKVDVIDHAIASLKRKTKNLPTGKAGEKLKTILLTPQGKTLTQKKAKTFSTYSDLLLVCGHYEGFDERVRKLVDEEISIGDYVLTGGEIPAMVLIDSVTRLIPGVLGKNESSREESFSMNKFIKNKQLSTFNFQLDKLIEYPQYTRPEKYAPESKKYKKTLSVPKILLSGNHEKIHKWRTNECLRRSKDK